MSPQQVLAVQSSFAVVAPQADALARRFYARLFELDPALRRLFKPDLAEQRDKLMAVLGVAVNGLGRIDALVPVLEGLGARHAGYGVRDAHYEVVATALLDTLAAGLGEAFTPTLRDAWTCAYTLLAAAMQAGARRALPAQPTRPALQGA